METLLKQWALILLDIPAWLRENARFGPTKLHDDRYSIQARNIMAKMGWRGRGPIGKSGEGITDPIAPQRVSARRGLGASSESCSTATPTFEPAKPLAGREKKNKRPDIKAIKLLDILYSDVRQKMTVSWSSTPHRSRARLRRAAATDQQQTQDIRG